MFLVLLVGWSQPASATQAQSQVFPSWTAFANGSNVTLTADKTVYHSGTQSLKFVNATSTSGDNGGFFQMIPVQPSTLYHLSAWVQGSNVASGATSNCFGLDQNFATLTCLPTGTFGWQQITWNYTTPANETSMTFALYSTNIGTVWYDDISVMQNGTSTNLVSNPGFEVSQDSISVLYPNPNVIYGSGAYVEAASTAPSFNWTAADSNGVALGSGGPVNTASGPAYFSLPNVNPGWYSLQMTTSTNSVYNAPFSLVSNGYVDNSAKPNPFGTNIHYYTAASTVPQAIGAAGLASARLDLIWSQIELSKGVYTWTPAADQLVGFLNGGGVRPLLLLGYSNPLYDNGQTPSSSKGIAAFAAFAAAAAQHYYGAADIDIFNEFNVAGTNNSACGTTPACYYALLVPAANAIHDVANGTRVVGPTLGGFTQDWIGSNPDSYSWLQQFVSLGGLSYLDVVDIHNYTFPTPAPPEGNNNAVIAAVKSLLTSHGSSLPLWLTETGWPTYSGLYTNIQQAQYIVRDAALSLQSGISQYMFYDFQDDCSPDPTGNCSFGLMLNPGASATTLSPKPGFTAYAVLARSLAGYTYNGSDNWGNGVYSLDFTNSSGSLQRIAWGPAANTTLMIQSTAAVTVTNWDGSQSTITPVSGNVTFSVGPDPVYVVGSAITGGSIATTPAFTATPPATVHHNQSVTITVAVNGAATGAPAGSITFSSAYGSTNVTATSGNTVTGNLVLSGFPNTGIVTVPINILQGSTVVGRLVVTMNVIT